MKDYKTIKSEVIASYGEWNIERVEYKEVDFYGNLRGRLKVDYVVVTSDGLGLGDVFKTKSAAIRFCKEY